jgi:hypothetical protein
MLRGTTPETIDHTTLLTSSNVFHETPEISSRVPDFPKVGIIGGYSTLSASALPGFGEDDGENGKILEITPPSTESNAESRSGIAHIPSPNYPMWHVHLTRVQPSKSCGNRIAAEIAPIVFFQESKSWLASDDHECRPKRSCGSELTCHLQHGRVEHDVQSVGSVLPGRHCRVGCRYGQSDGLPQNVARIQEARKSHEKGMKVWSHCKRVPSFQNFRFCTPSLLTTSTFRAS